MALSLHLHPFRIVYFYFRKQFTCSFIVLKLHQSALVYLTGSYVHPNNIIIHQLLCKLVFNMIDAQHTINRILIVLWQCSGNYFVTLNLNKLTFGVHFFSQVQQVFVCHLDVLFGAHVKWQWLPISNCSRRGNGVGSHKKSYDSHVFGVFQYSFN